MNVFAKWSSKLQIPVYSKLILANLKTIQEDGTSKIERVRIQPDHASLDGIFKIMGKIVNFVEQPPLKKQKVIQKIIVTLK